MRAGWRFQLPRALSLAAPLGLLACGSLIGLGELEKVDCAVSCDEARAGSVSGGTGTSPGAAGTTPSSSGVGNSSQGGVAGASAGGTTAGVAGSLNGGSAGSTSGGTSGSGGGSGPGSSVCPGGPEPAPTWTEHWFEHDQKLTRVHYDDCVVVYFDGDTSLGTKDWLVPFLNKAWSYSLATYGQMGNERIYVVVHQGRYQGGHSSTFIEASHDNHAVIDMGADEWTPGDYDLPAHLLSFLVDTQGAHTKFGAPMGGDYDNVGFPLIYKYDLYLALGLDAVAADAFIDFNALKNGNPYANTFWFRDWFYPVWRDHGHAKLFANYETLLEKYFPASADHWMPEMSYGQYFHFMSGAAGVDLVPEARKAFVWHPDFDDEVAAAKADFPDIKY
ncbi:MAG TPA: hypothetical protein VHP33_01770 [Polyangiaceae bacterium]|nr:hypothetical protein [Polyangiaceae bacterium]